MFQRISYLLLSLAVIVVPASAAPTAMPPLNKWALDYGYTQCTASREFASEGKAYMLAFRPPILGDTYELVVSHDGSAPSDATQNDAVIVLDGTPKKAMLLTYGLRKPTAKRVSRYHLPTEVMMGAKAVRSMSFDPRNAPELSFAVGDMTGLFAALDKCVADLRMFWNYGGSPNPDVPKAGTSLRPGKSAPIPSKGDVRSVFTSDDYPYEALIRGQQGSGQYVLLIDEKGAVADCTVFKTSGIPVFDVRSCQVMRERAKFQPATGADGHAQRGLVVTPEISFRIDNSSLGTRLAPKLPVEQYPQSIPERDQREPPSDPR